MANAGAFRGVRVLDFTQGIAGPYAAMLLAEQGADVIKVEPPAGDRIRGKPAFHVLNRSKRGIVLDLESDDGRAKALELASGADVVLVDALADALEQRSIDYATVSGRNPSVVYCNLPLYGSEGPERGPAARRRPPGRGVGRVGVAVVLSRGASLPRRAHRLVCDRRACGGGDCRYAIRLRAHGSRRLHRGLGLGGAFALQSTSYVVPLAAMEILRLRGATATRKGPSRPTVSTGRATASGSCWPA